MRQFNTAHELFGQSIEIACAVKTGPGGLFVGFAEVTRNCVECVFGRWCITVGLSTNEGRGLPGGVYTYQ
jgi:hypothetical protein